MLQQDLLEQCIKTIAVRNGDHFVDYKVYKYSSDGDYSDYPSILDLIDEEIISAGNMQCGHGFTVAADDLLGITTEELYNIICTWCADTDAESLNTNKTSAPEVDLKLSAFQPSQATGEGDRLGIKDKSDTKLSFWNSLRDYIISSGEKSTCYAAHMTFILCLKHMRKMHFAVPWLTENRVLLNVMLFTMR